MSANTTKEEVANNTRTEMEQAFNFGVKHKVTPRDGSEEELHIRPFFTEQAFAVIDQLEAVFNMAKSMATESGDVDLFQLFKSGREQCLVLLAAALEKDRTWVGRLEIDDLLEVFGIVFQQNKDFFAQRVKTSLETVVGQISSTLSTS